MYKDALIVLYASQNKIIINFRDITGNCVQYMCIKKRIQSISDFAKSIKEKYFCEEIQLIIRRNTKEVMEAIQLIKEQVIKILSIKDDTPIPHNGCIPERRRKNNG